MKTKILLVDDETDLEDLFSKRFRREINANEYEFVFVHDGLEALNTLEQQPDIDLILSDINMPGMDGLSLLAKLPDINPMVRAVMVTAYGDMDNIRTAMNLGAFDFLTKPINFNDLQLTIEKTRRYVNQLRETAELKAVDEMKTRFFANITHELRTPLTMIVSPVDKLLETPDLPTPYQQHLTLVQRNARQLLRLINQLLDINKLEAQQMDLVNEVGDLPGFIGQIVDLFRPSADIKNLALTFQTDMSPGNYLFDAGKWEKILYNLLSNAIKFTPAGSITVSLQQTATGVRLIVRDTGIGIPADKIVHVFDRFYQIDNARARAYEGTGIGLALVKELTSRLGGTIRVESQADSTGERSGTEFVLEIPVQLVSGYVDAQPVAAPTLVVDPPSTPTGIEPSFHPKSSDQAALVLVVEDNAELREFIVAELATSYRIRAAANGYEGWILAKEELPDVIISDLMMPRMDGYALIDRLRTDLATDHIPVMLLTASLEPDSRLKGLEYGADEYLTKPFHVGELRLRLRNLLSRQQKLRDHYRQQLAQPDTTETSETVQDQFLRRLYQLVEQRLDDSTLSVEWLADQMAMSRKTLYLKVHNLTHLPPNELIRQYRLRKAIDLLRLGHNASETAYMVGFESPSYFTKVFREFYQQTPTDYVKR
ncbi:response regulator [Spirosoma taeanense]|uniref:histidine kinase n=1 Tax=Spirosoma taeanense TaxID=2735870 RepID=A0A6M5YEU6_9BACT|nr:response regulator [Spirosoma taeanense]QJW91522.1 response regulator [Spirosoma taeanense]